MTLRLAVTLRLALSLRLTVAAVLTAVLVALGAVPASAAPGAFSQDFDGDGRADVVAAAATDGSLYLYPGSGSSGWRPSAKIGRGWQLLDSIGVAGDWDGDARADVLARHIGTGDLLMYRGDGRGGFLSSARVGTGWSGFTRIVLPGDWTGDGRPDVLAVSRADGSLWLYPGNGRGGWYSPRRVGTGWLGLDLVTAVGDWDGDGRPDLVGLSRATGDLWLYSGDGSGGFVRSRVIGSGWGSVTALLGPGDFSGDGRSDLLARDARGSLVLYRGDGRGGFAPRPYPVVGSGWNALLLDEPTQVPRRVLRYSVASLGAVGADVGYFGRHVDWTLNDPRGWALGRELRFDRVSSGGDFTVYLASPAQVAAASPVCSATWSCRVGNRVYINDERWRNGTTTYAGRPLDDYRHYVVNHEVGHWFELGHWSCGGSGQPAPVMQQQSKSLDGCRSNVWPLPAEKDRARAFALR